MHIKSISIKNVRSIEELEWAVPENKAAGWHVIIGDSGTGKTTFVRCIALALVGPAELQAMWEEWNDWMRPEEDTAQVRVELTVDNQKDAFTGRGSVGKRKLIAGVKFVRDSENGNKVDIAEEPAALSPERYVWGSGKGWFSAGYGPFRRFSGGDKDDVRIMFTKPKLARHLSLLFESAALGEAVGWIQSMRFKQLENKIDGAFLENLKQFINQDDFLPYGARIVDVSSEGVKFIDGNGYRVWLEDMSDGYRSVLSMTFELIRQLEICYGSEGLFDVDGETIKVIVPGVVLIDEVDAHLHPTWQRRIGLWFRKHFPNIQFIVTTHSPLVCQAADHGTVFKLPTPGTDETGRMITGVELDRLLYGNVLDAYSTGVFGADVTRSISGEQRLERLAELNFKELDDTLTSEERREQENLRAMMPTTSHVLFIKGVRK